MVIPIPTSLDTNGQTTVYESETYDITLSCDESIVIVRLRYFDHQTVSHLVPDDTVECDLYDFVDQGPSMLKDLPSDDARQFEQFVERLRQTHSLEYEHPPEYRFAVSGCWHCDDEGVDDGILVLPCTLRSKGVL